MRMFLQLLHANFSAAVMVLGIVSNNDEGMPPHFLQGLWVNAADNKEVLERVVKPWIEHEKRKAVHLTKPCLLIGPRQHKNGGVTISMITSFQVGLPSSPDQNQLYYYV